MRGMKVILASLLIGWVSHLQAKETVKSWSETTVVLGVGTNETIPAPAGQRVQVGDGKILRAEEAGQKVRLIGRKKGSTVVQIGSTERDVVVLEAPDFTFYHRLKEALRDMMGLQLSIENGTIIIGGRLLRLDDWIELHDLAHSNNHYWFKASIEPEVQNEVQFYFKNVLKENQLALPIMKLQPALISLAPETSDLIRYQETMGAYGFKIESNPQVLTPEPLIRVQITVTESKKNSMQKYGIEWPTSYQAQLLPSLTGGADPLTATLHALERTGNMKILASPSLLCRSGKEAEFLAGGELPIKLISKTTHEVSWKKYGILLKVKPKADFSGRMSVSLSTEISSIDDSHSVDGVPAMLTNRIESHFDLTQKKTIALSGLIKHEKAEASSGLPGLSRLPILGPLFSSKEFRDDQSELVIFVTPEVVKPEEQNESPTI